MEPYEVVSFKPKLNKKKVILIILIVILIILFCIYVALKLANAEYDEQMEKIQEQIIAQQDTIQTENQSEIVIIENEKEQPERNLLKNSQPLTEEQLDLIENIYTEGNQKRAFLTFDDGPTDSVTPLILDLLKKENIKATFFVLGNRVNANPELVQREFEEGHYIANHGYSHVYSKIYQNPENVLDEYNYTEQCIQEALNNPNYNSRVFRFPGGSNGGTYNNVKQISKQLLRNNDIAYLDWNCLSRDAEGANTVEQLYQNVVETIGEKQTVVILMHDSSDKILTYEVLPDVIKYLRENDYTFMNLYDIL